LAALKARVAKLAEQSQPPAPAETTRAKVTDVFTSRNNGNEVSRRLEAARSRMRGLEERAAPVVRRAMPAVATDPSAADKKSKQLQPPRSGGDDFLSLMSTWTKDDDVTTTAEEVKVRRRAVEASAALDASGPLGKKLPIEDWGAQKLREAALTSPLLAQMRLFLAEDKVSKAPPEYASLCAHLQEEGDNFERLSTAEVVAVRRVKKVPENFSEPVLLETRAT